MLSLYFLSIFYAGVQASLTYKGADWSSVGIEEAAGRTYKNAAGTVQPLETILAANGVNTVRQRLWVADSSDYNLAYNLKLSKRANAAGLNVYLDMHFSDTWADPSEQTKPSGWSSTIEDLTNDIYTYTKSVCNSYADAGLPLSIVSIGNEITAGLVWPIGTTSSYYNIAALLHSAAWGIKDSDLSTKPQIMIHTDNGWEWATQKYFYTAVLAAGPLLTTDFDMMGVSYYPFYNSAATLASLKSSLTSMASTWGKSLVVAETNWPVVCSSPAYSFPSDCKAIAISASGQTTWMKDVAKVVSAVSGGVGLFYWEPAWVDNAALGSSCSDNAMWEYSGTMRSSVSVFSSI